MSDDASCIKIPFFASVALCFQMDPALGECGGERLAAFSLTLVGNG
jgi:hypothetical protein